MTAEFDAIVVGSGPNGLMAAITLARQGMHVCVMEAADTIGGGVRSMELTLPGFVHDVCSAIHPMAVCSPCFAELPLEKHGLEWIQAGAPLAHPLPEGKAAALYRSMDETVASLRSDGPAYRRLMEPFTKNWEALAAEFLQPLLHSPKHPLLLARFGLQGLRTARGLAAAQFKNDSAQALFAGLAAHSTLPLTAPGSAAFALMLGVMGHAVGWPMPRGGAQQISNALAEYLLELGGVIKTGSRVETLSQLFPVRTILFDIAPRQLLRIVNKQRPYSYRRKLALYRHGPGVFKMDFALSDPIPWKADVCRRAGTIHVGGTMAEIACAEAMVANGRHPERPFVLLAQPSLHDSTRSPAGKHVAWAYCHVPNGSAFDMSDRIQGQIERFAPGFRDLILARRFMKTADLELRNPNLVGGDISGGANDLAQLIARPIFSPAPYRTPWRGLYLCSSSTPPGGGVHGMCGYNAAKVALHDISKS